jgi:Glycosyl transferase family 11
VARYNRPICDDSRVIAVRLMGGLGNQMFQYAVGRALADEHNVQLVLDISHFDAQPSTEVPRHLEVDCFRIRAEVSRNRIPTGNALTRRVVGGRRLRAVHETGFSFDSRILALPDDTLLIGYWQSERYFETNAEAIRRDFTPRFELTERTRSHAGQIDDSTVCLHVRRADYVSHAISAQVHGFVGLDYYRSALEHIVEAGVTPRLLVISDEPEWCSQHLDLGYPMTVVDRLPGRSYEDMLLMSKCRYIVIANSSFSWWGAWLSDALDKIVVAPKNWFVGSHYETHDLIPAGWIQL